MNLSKTVAFLAETPGSPTVDSQKKLLAADDEVVLAGKHKFGQLTELLARNGMALKTGDRVKVIDLTCLGLSTVSLIRVLTNLLADGISVEIVQPGIVITPRDIAKNHALLDALDGHYRHMHGVKTHPADGVQQGRRALLHESQLPEIRAMLDKPGAKATEVAKELGVGRSTLFNYLDRYDGGRNVRRRKKAPKRGAQDAGDDAHVTKGEGDQSAA